MSKSVKPTCEACYFRRAGLCALGSDTPCPTFRAARRNGLEPPRQATLVARTTRAVAGATA